MADFVRGDGIRASAVFANLAGVATDPTTITFRFRAPSAVVTTYVHGTDAQLVKDSTGNYHADFTVDSAGTWYYRWEGTGTIIAAAEASLDVDQGQF